MDADTGSLAKRYDDAVAAGQMEIGERWTSLSEHTKRWLQSSMRYSERGQFAPADGEQAADDVERFEYELGSLRLCAKASLPLRGNVGETIPREALDDYLLTAAAEVLHGHPSRERAFLRTALAAVRQHEMAKLLMRMPANSGKTSPGVKLSFVVMLGLITVLLGLSSPFLVGFALVSAMERDLPATVVALYGVAAFLGSWQWLKNMDGADESPNIDQLAYQGWWQLNPYASGPWLAVGAGAAEHLREMLRRGVIVPPVAFDLCAMLTFRTTYGDGHRVVDFGP